jgi:hypothetical protein
MTNIDFLTLKLLIVITTNWTTLEIHSGEVTRWNIGVRETNTWVEYVQYDRTNLVQVASAVSDPFDITRVRPGETPAWALQQWQAPTTSRSNSCGAKLSPPVEANRIPKLPRP